MSTQQPLQTTLAVRFCHGLACALVLAAVCGCATTPSANSGTELRNIPYKTGAALSGYELQRCVLDIYLPHSPTGFATLVWFHGGGLTTGSKDKVDREVSTPAIARSLARAGVCVVVPNYRLSPKAKFPTYVEDAAAAVAWTHAHIAEHGGAAGKLFVGGHSAGGYLALMVGMDASYLEKYGLPLSAVAGLIPVSGQVMTHYTVRAERDLGKFTVTADAAAPVFFVRKDTPPMLVLYADHDMAARAEENAYLVALLQGAGNQGVTGAMIANRTHGSIAGKLADGRDPARRALLDFIKANGGAP
jgi:acetyl esterase/lipase